MKSDLQRQALIKSSHNVQIGINLPPFLINFPIKPSSNNITDF